MRIPSWIRQGAPLALLGLVGCSFAPKHFGGIDDPAPITRARSVSLGSKLPQQQVVPALIDRLEDKDPVVRIAAHEELKKGTGRTFGFIPWAGETERASAVSRWRSWWKERQAALVRFGQNR
jgi:HEAT repeat protein